MPNDPVTIENIDDDRIINALLGADRETAYKTLLTIHRTFLDSSQPVKTCFSVPLYHFSTARLQQLWDLGIKPLPNRSGMNHLKIAVYSQVTEPSSKDDLASYLYKVRAELEALMIKMKISRDGWESLDYLRAVQSAATNHREAIARLKRIYKMVYREEWRDPVGGPDEVEEFSGLCSYGQMSSRSGERERWALRR